MPSKFGAAPHLNSFELGQHGRYRTNVWQYRGVNTLKPDRSAELALHPTVKPVAMIADALKDCSRRGGIVLDPFGGSGSTLIAAAKTGRRARLIELDPVYVDRIIRRWQGWAHDTAIHADTGKSFEDRAKRVGEAVLEMGISTSGTADTTYTGPAPQARHDAVRASRASAART